MPVNGQMRPIVHGSTPVGETHEPAGTIEPAVMPTSAQMKPVGHGVVFESPVPGQMKFTGQITAALPFGQ